MLETNLTLTASRFVRLGQVRRMNWLNGHRCCHGNEMGSIMAMAMPRLGGVMRLVAARLHLSMKLQ